MLKDKNKFKHSKDKKLDQKQEEEVLESLNSSDSIVS